MPQMHSRGGGRDGLSLLPLFIGLVLHHHNHQSGVEHGRFDSSGHRAAAEPLRQRELAGDWEQSDSDRQIALQVSLNML